LLPRPGCFGAERAQMLHDLPRLHRHAEDLFVLGDRHIERRQVPTEMLVDGGRAQALERLSLERLDAEQGVFKLSFFQPSVEFDEDVDRAFAILTRSV
jgi:hypothetical protein